MNILQMSLSGAVLILAVVVLRTLAMKRLPKDTFLILWGIVLLRLTVPYSVPSELSVYSWIEKNMNGRFNDISVINQPVDNREIDSMGINIGMNNMNDNSTQESPAQNHALDKNDTSVVKKPDHNSRRFVSSSLICMVVWCVGMLSCMIYFTVLYLRCRFEFQTALPVENPFAQHWLAEHPHRCPAIRQSDKISTPLTFGIWRPVILMPKNTDWENTQQLEYILMHEYIHICRYDVLSKLLATYALCVHWFNPFVWIMYILFNRDVEISCDEHVVRCFGENAKSVYAKILIQMEAQRSNIRTYLPLGSGFLFKIGDNAMEERITAIMKIKKKSLSAAVLAAGFILSMTAVFATSAAGKTAAEDEVQKTSDFTSTEYEKLLALQLEGYREMNISDYQEAVWRLTDTREYRDLLERFSQDETLYAV